MVKKKNDSVIEEAAPVVEHKEAAEQTPLQPDATERITYQPDTSIVADTAGTGGDIPLKAIDYLKRHTEFREVYIDRYGGVFPTTTPHVLMKEATLYSNPYSNS